MIERSIPPHRPCAQPVSNATPPSPCEAHIAIEMLEQNLGKETAVEVVRSFVAFLSEVTVELQSCIRNRNAVSARKLIHELSHSCNVMGATELMRACLLLEDAIAKADWEHVEARMDRLSAELRSLGYSVTPLLS